MGQDGATTANQLSVLTGGRDSGGMGSGDGEAWGEGHGGGGRLEGEGQQIVITHRESSIISVTHHTRLTPHLRLARTPQQGKYPVSKNFC